MWTSVSPYPEARSLADLRVQGAGIVNRVDVDDRKVVVYLEEVAAQHTTCVRLQAVQEYEVKNLKPAPSSVVSPVASTRNPVM
jgi:Fe2+ or Zn2+ uptake regulation protein